MQIEYLIQGVKDGQYLAHTPLVYPYNGEIWTEWIYEAYRSKSKIEAINILNNLTFAKQFVIVELYNTEK